MDERGQASETPAQDQSISVEIYDQVYHLRGTDPAYIDHLAQMVDDKMRAVAANGGTVDSLRVAVLASLNIADELQCMRERHAQLVGSLKQSQSAMRSRSESLSGMLDEVLDYGPGEFQSSIRRAG